MIEMAPASILFDLDDTLVDRAAGLRRYSNLLHHDMRSTLCDCTVDELHAELLAADDFGSFEQAVKLSRSAIWQNPHEPEGLMQHWLSRFGEAAVAFPGALMLLQDLRHANVKIGVITNGESTMQRSKITALGITGLLDTIIVSSEVGLAKPGRAIFLCALAQLNCSAKTAWFVGDHPVTDIKGAREAGLRPFWVKTGVHREQTNVAGTHLTDLDDLRRHL